VWGSLTSKSLVSLGVHWLLVALGVVVVAALRAPLAARHDAAKGHEEVSLLLEPEYTRVLSLGHREALADYLFASTLVEYGTSFQGKQRFEAAYRYLDTITTLAPKFDRPYLFADTLLTMRPQPATLEDYMGARRLQERGLEALPYHSELWMVAGQFAAYVAPPHLPAESRADFKRAGAAAMARACELASNNENIPYHCIAAARMLNRSGEREAMMRMLTRTLAVNDDPTIRELALAYLGQASNERERERFERRGKALEAEWKASLPHASRALVSLLGPGPSRWRCAGANASRSPGCFTAWRDWGDTVDRAE
jgi:hypothetical protein